MTDLGALNLGDNQLVEVTFDPKDAAGQSVAVTIDAAGFDASLLKVDVAADDLSATITALGPIGGPTTVTFTGTNPDGSTVDDEATVEITVVAGPAVTLGAVLGTPQDQPTPPAGRGRPAMSSRRR